MSTQTFDIYSYIASLKGNIAILDQQIAQNKQILQSASTSLPTVNQQLQSVSRSGGPNGLSADQANAVTALGNQINSLQSQINTANSNISSFTQQESNLNSQITAAQSVANSIPRTTSTISSPSVLSNLGSIPPSYLLIGAGAILLILLIK